MLNQNHSGEYKMSSYVEITSKEELESYISEFGDYEPETNYLSKTEGGDCFIIFGCTYASEAFKAVGEGNSLVITNDYNEEIKAQLSSEFPDMMGFAL